MKCKFPFNWTLKNSIFTKDKGTVFSCFACGGGSTMGYKLAGFDVVGCNEIDPKINEVYVENHHPRLNFNCDIRELVTKAKEKTLPHELYNLDILDGSPPCSTFSIAGNRERDWGKEKKFREGQSKQILDTLFFDFIELAKELKPKVVVSENVKGILLGNAIDYVRRIYKDFEDAGYYCNHFLLDASKMGVPQKRERVFFVCIRHDLGLNFLKVSGLFNVEPYINMTFTEIPILMNEIADFEGREIKSATMRKLWENRIYGDIDQSDANVRLYGKKSNFNQQYVYLEKVCYTLASKESCLLHMNQPKMLSKSEVCKISTFPSDYNFYNVSPHYICGMSVPPVMMAQIAQRIWEYWLSKLQTTKENMNNIFTICYSEEEANEVGHFIMSKGYEGVQNDSYRYCDTSIWFAFHEAERHHKDCIYVGVNGYQMVVSHIKRELRRNGLKYIEKKRIFYNLLSRY